MGDPIRLDASFEYCNNIKLLIKYKENNMNLKPIKRYFHPKIQMGGWENKPKPMSYKKP